MEEIITSTPVSQPQQQQPSKRVVIGLPGTSFSDRFLLSWSASLGALINKNYDVIISPGNSSFVPFARMKTLGLNVLRGAEQKPFNGQNYDIYVTLDSDMVFSSQQLIALIESVDNEHPVVAGYYMMDDLKSLAVVKDWDIPYFVEHGTFKFLSEQDISSVGETFVKVCYVGLGFFACKKSVLDALRYPYFHSELIKFTLPDKEIVDISSEDVAFCRRIQQAGFPIHLHTKLRVGHDKRLVI